MKTIQRNLALLFTALILFTSACGAEATASPLSGTLGELSGTVNAKLGGSAEFKAVQSGDILQANDQVQTGEDGRVRIDLSSGTIVRVAPSSLFTLVSNETVDGGLATKLKLELGRIYIILNGGSMDVDTPSGVASVRGSWMMVEIDPETQNVVITCLEGSCSADDVDFTDGQKVTLFYYDPATGEYRPPLLENMTEEEFQQWLEENPEAAQILSQVLTQKAPPLATPTFTALPDPAASPTATPVIITSSDPGCFKLVAPPDNALVNSSGLITFKWDAQEGAARYEVVFTSPGGSISSFNTTTTSISNYIEIFPLGGIYTWQVTAMDASGGTICTATAFVFNKSAYEEPAPYIPPASKTPKPRVPPTLTPVPTKTPLATYTPRPTKTPVPTKTPLPTATPTEVACTYELAQWEFPDLPCYCNPNIPGYELPPYCPVEWGDQ